jgi:NTP pyrophosphatase (non-canonical NTP hydrolase)
MTDLLEEYSKFVDKTYKYSFDDYDLLYLSNGMGGEVGEAQNEIKKMYRLLKNTTLENAKEQKRDEIKKELGDVLWYLTAICNKMDISLTDIINENIDKNKKHLN